MSVFFVFGGMASLMLAVETTIDTVYKVKENIGFAMQRRQARKRRKHHYYFA